MPLCVFGFVLAKVTKYNCVQLLTDNDTIDFSEGIRMDYMRIQHSKRTAGRTMMY